MSWQNREDERKTDQAIVILDGKNTPGDIRSSLSRHMKEKGTFPLYAFVASEDGSHKPVLPGDDMWKGNDYSSRYRQGEIEQIVALDRTKGVGVLVVVNDLDVKADEVINTVNTIRRQIHGIKVIVMGPELPFEKPAEAVISHMQPHFLEKQLETWGFSKSPSISHGQ